MPESKNRQAADSASDHGSAGGGNRRGSIGQRFDGALPVVRIRSLVALSLWALAVFLIFRFFDASSFVLLGLLGAAAVAAALQPLADRVPGPPGLGAVVTMLTAVVVVAALLGLLGWAMYGPLMDSVEQWPQLRQSANDGLQAVSDGLGIRQEWTVSEIGQVAGRLLTGDTASEWLANIAGSLMAAVLAILVVVIGAMYLLARHRGELAEQAAGLLPPKRREPTRKALSELQPELRWWLIGMLFSMVVVGVVSGTGYWLIGLKFALPLALFAGLAQAVPTFGPMITLVLAFLVAATQGTVQMVGVVATYIVVQTGESYFLTPMVMQKAVDIPPIITLFTIILWGNVFGVAGLILAIPLDVTIWVFLKHHIVEQHRSDRPDGRDGRQ